MPQVDPLRLLQMYLGQPGVAPPMAPGMGEAPNLGAMGAPPSMDAIQRALGLVPPGMEHLPPAVLDSIMTRPVHEEGRGPLFRPQTGKTDDVAAEWRLADDARERLAAELGFGRNQGQTLGPLPENQRWHPQWERPDWSQGMTGPANRYPMGLNSLYGQLPGMALY